MSYPKTLTTLIQTLKKLPGVGQKTAERFAFQMLSWQEKDLINLSTAVSDVKQNLTYCSDCGCLIETGPCNYCTSTKRDPKTLCIVSSAKDVFAIEEMRLFNGIFHVMHGLLSPMDGRTVTDLDLNKLKARIQSLGTQEVIIALDSTVEGDATALFLKKELEPLGLFLSRLALGLPMGSSLDFVDEGTLSRAFAGRHSF
ncbi:MAG: recombination mediator RecR [Simkaniaceae bacterium]|nr:recombination mediator RecR [Simkaniaceae bacterium]